MSWSGVYVFWVRATGAPSELDFHDALDQLRALEPLPSQSEAAPFLEHAWLKQYRAACSFFFGDVDGLQACIRFLRELFSRRLAHCTGELEERIIAGLGAIVAFHIFVFTPCMNGPMSPGPRR